MTAYLITVCLIVAAAWGGGGRLSQRQRASNGGRLSLATGGILLVAGILWLLTAWFARNYSDADGFGSDIAGWFAHSGKWLTLLAAMMFGHGWICGTGQIPTGKARRIFYYVAVLGISALVMFRSMPVYFLLDDGQRDENGYLRQSRKIETTCGAVALLNYLEQFCHHSPLTERKVAQVCGITAEGATTFSLVKAAHHFGLTNAAARVLTLDELEKTRLPVIVSVSTLPTMHHATLLVRLDAEHADFIDPAYGKWSVPRSRFREIWYGKTVLLER